MADRMNALCFCVSLAAAGLLAAAGAQAQAPARVSPAGLSDPTRPPSAGAFGDAQDDAPAGRQLQSVLFSGGRKLAIIDGTVVRLGGRLGEARVVSISETAVTLRTGNETEVLKLYPAIDKRPVKRVTSRALGAAPGKSGHGGSK